jgi:hypothetical protein
MDSGGPADRTHCAAIITIRNAGSRKVLPMCSDHSVTHVPGSDTPRRGRRDAGAPSAASANPELIYKIQDTGCKFSAPRRDEWGIAISMPIRPSAKSRLDFIGPIIHCLVRESRHFYEDTGRKFSAPPRLRVMNRDCDIDADPPISKITP